LAFGYQLDKWLNTSPWLMILFLLFGIAAGFINVFRVASRVKEKEGD
jgi:ATP synthase protein I